jgi:hypothetical protein
LFNAGDARSRKSSVIEAVAKHHGAGIKYGNNKKLNQQ